MNIERLMADGALQARVAMVVPLAILILYADFTTAPALVAAIAYIPLVGLLYGVTRPAAFVGFGVLTTLFTVAGAFTELSESNFDDMVFNRLLTAISIGGGCVLIYFSGLRASQLGQLASTDPLTRVYNRRHFMELMAREQHSAERYGVIYAILMIDIDHFKKVNDTYGHQIGDQVIRATADAFRGAVRPPDIVARYGGEEFVIVLPHTNRKGALILAERVRRIVANIVVPAGNAAVSFTVSIGVSSYSEQLTADQIIGQADLALYKAKKNGRNQVCSHDEPTVSVAE